MLCEVHIRQAATLGSFLGLARALWIMQAGSGKIRRAASGCV